MAATSEPRTHAEMHRRFLTAQANGSAAARRYEEWKHAADVQVPVPRATDDEPAALRDLSIRQIIARVAAAHGVSAEQIVGASLSPHIVVARFTAMAAVAEARSHFSLAQIGRAFGGRHHTTVLSALRRVRAGLVFSGRSPGAPTPEAILSDVAAEYGTTVRLLQGSRCSKSLVLARRTAAIAVREAHPDLPATEIARLLNRDPRGIQKLLATIPTPAQPTASGRVPAVGGTR